MKLLQQTRIKLGILALLVLGCILLIRNFQINEWPGIQRWILSEIHEQSKKHSPVVLTPDRFHLSLFPLGIVFKDVKVTPQKELAYTLAPTMAKTVRVTMNLWSLLKGQIRIGQIYVDQAVINVFVKNISNPSKRPQISLKQINQIPIDSVRLENIEVGISLEPMNLIIHTNQLNIGIINRFKSLRAQVETKSIKLKKTTENILFQSDIKTHLVLDKDGIYISDFDVARGESTVTGHGAALGNIFNNDLHTVQGQLKGHLQLPDINRIFRELKVAQNLPDMSGQLKFETELDYVLNNFPRAQFLIQTEDLRIDKYQIGQIHAVGKAKDDELKISQLQIQGGYGLARSTGLKLKLSAPYNFEGNAIGDKFDIRELLKSLNIAEIPLYSKLDGQINCLGQIGAPWKIDCPNGKFHTDSLAIRLTSLEKKQNEIVALNDATVEGSVNVTKTDVTYKTNLQIGTSKGTSSGQIIYAKGFNINYETPALQLSDINNLLELKPEGLVQLKGHTKGDSRTATIDMSVKGEKLWLYDYALGKAEFDVSYKKGKLNFQNLQGQLNSTQYNTSVSIDITTSRISVKGKSPFVDANDLMTAFERKVKLPFAVSGTGSAQWDIDGPLKFNELSYRFNSNLFRGTIADESFDQIEFNVKSKNGYVETDKVLLTKGRSQIHAEGNVQPTGKMNLSVLGRNFQIEQSENLSKLKLNMTGNYDFDMELSDHILKPKMYLIGELSNVTIGEVSAPNSIVKLRTNEHELLCEGSLIGNNLVFGFNFPFDTKSSLKIKLQAKNWNFAQTFSIFSSQLLTSQYQAEITGDAEFTVPRSDIDSMNGHLLVEKILLRNGNLEMSNPKPMQLTASNGRIDTQNFEMVGESTYVRLRPDTQKSYPVDLVLEGRIDLSFLSILTPFLEDLRGNSSFTLAVQGKPTAMTVTGTAYLSDVLLKLNGFPHALEQMSGDVTFGRKEIILSTLRGRLGGGLIQASGRIQTRDHAQVPVDIKGTFTDSRINVPDGFNTRGSGEFFVKGNWFPYIVGVNYQIDTGKIIYTNQEKASNVPEIKPSTYLPKSLSTQRFSPVELQLDIIFNRDIPVRMQISRIDIKTDVHGRMKVNGPPESLKLTGKIQVQRGGRVSFRNNNFEIISGTVDYDNGPPDNPTLNISAQARVTAQTKTNEFRDYDVDLKVVGTAQSPKISVSSDPPLQESELLSLLTLGFITDTQTDENSVRNSSRVANTSYQLGSAYLNEVLGINRTIEERLGIQFSFGSSYDDTDQAARHKFVIKKQWSPKFGTSVSREIGKTSTSNVKAEYKLNKRVSVIGQWQGIQSTGSERVDNQQEQNLFGVDMEYKLEFK